MIQYYCLSTDIEIALFGARDPLWCANTGADFLLVTYSSNAVFSLLLCKSLIK